MLGEVSTTRADACNDYQDNEIHIPPACRSSRPDFAYLSNTYNVRVYNEVIVAIYCDDGTEKSRLIVHVVKPPMASGRMCAFFRKEIDPTYPSTTRKRSVVLVLPFAAALNARAESGSDCEARTAMFHMKLLGVVW